MIKQRQTLSYTTFIALILVVIVGCLIIFISSTGQPAGKDNLTWKKYVDRDHGFSLEIPSQWQGKWLKFEHFDIQSGFNIYTEILNPCTNSEKYRKDILSTNPFHEIAPLENNRLDGFMVLGMHMDNGTPGSEAYIVNCPNLIRLNINSIDYPNSEALFRQIVASVKIWPPGKNSQL